MKVDKQTGCLVDVSFVPSPNCDQRPFGLPIDLLVIHNISLPPGQFGGLGIHQLFSNQLDPHAHPAYVSLHGLKVSAHCVIYRTGEVVQFVPFSKRAWHAGVSLYEGRAHCNNFSIGIELEGTDHHPFEKIQYMRLVELTHALFEAYPTLTADRIVGHSDIAPGRKTDPGPAFEWAYYHEQLKVKR